MKRRGFLFDHICDFENLYAAFKKAFSGAGRTPEACGFYFHLETELIRLQRQLTDQTYQPAPYRYFTIHDPKERVISVAPFSDRVVHHALVRVLEPIFEPTFIFDSYATRKNKGTHRAVRRAQVFARKNRWFLKIDIAGYFDAIDHEILLGLVARKVKDPSALALTAKIISNSDISRGLAKGKGLPIGNLTSQFFANVYLNPFDHYVKQSLGMSCYIRYMDDMVFFGDDRTHLKAVGTAAARFLDDHLKLALKPTATLLNSREHGLPFLGFRIFPRLVRVRRANLDRSLSHYNDYLRAYEKGVITEDELADRGRSIVDHVAFADSHWLRSNLFGMGGRRKAAPTG